MMESELAEEIAQLQDGFLLKYTVCNIDFLRALLHKKKILILCILKHKSLDQ